MEKISGIIPANARTRSVDVSNSQPVRPGAPAWGRREGRVTRTEALTAMPEDRITRSATDKVAALKTPTYNSKAEVTKPEVTRAQIVDELNKKFFEGTPKSQVRENDLAMSEERLSTIDEAETFAPISTQK